MISKNRLPQLLHSVTIVVALATISQSACKTSDSHLASKKKKLDPVIEKGLNFVDRQAVAWKSKIRPDLVATADQTCTMSCHSTYPFMLVHSYIKPDSKVVNFFVKQIGNRMQGYAEGSAQPPYSWAHDSSKSVEVLLSAVSLLAHESSTLRSKNETFSSDTKTALKLLWKEQTPKGDWEWMEFANFAPWEDPAARYWGAAQVARAIGDSQLRSPKSFQEYIATNPEAKKGIEKLSNFLSDNINEKPFNILHNRIALVWANRFLTMASQTTKALISKDEEKKILVEIIKRQAPDGSWNFASIIEPSGRSDSKKRDGPNGYSTGLCVSVLKDFKGYPSLNSRISTAIVKGLNWIRKNQNSSDGSWPTPSYNERVNEDNVEENLKYRNGLVTDAASAYAILGLIKN